MLCVAQTSAHSERTLSTPRSRNWRKPCACLICPKTGSTMVLRPLDHRYQLLLVVGLLAQGLPDNELQCGLDGGLCVIGLHEAVRPLHDARFRIGEVMLRLWLGLRGGAASALGAGAWPAVLVRVLVLLFCFGAGTRVQRLFGLGDAL